MKKISLFAILGLVASLALADTVYYPGNTYKVDGKVQFINSGQRPTWNDNGTVYGLATTNDISEASEGLIEAVGTITNTMIPEINQNVTTVSNNVNTVADNLSTVSNSVNTVTDNLTTVSNKVNTIEENLSTVSNSVNTITDNLTTVSNKVNTIEDNLTTVSNSVETIKLSYVKTLNNKNGDVSITEGENVILDTTESTSIKIDVVPQPERTVYTIDDASVGEEIDTDTYAEQYFTWGSLLSSDETISLYVPEATSSKIGYLILYFDEIYDDSEQGGYSHVYDFEKDNSYIIGLPSDQFWTNNTDSGAYRSTWKIELESVPGSDQWFFKKATEFVISKPSN